MDRNKGKMPARPEKVLSRETPVRSRQGLLHGLPYITYGSVAQRRAQETVNLPHQTHRRFESFPAHLQHAVLAERNCIRPESGSHPTGCGGSNPPDGVLVPSCMRKPNW